MMVSTPKNGSDNDRHKYGSTRWMVGEVCDWASFPVA